MYRDADKEGKGTRGFWDDAKFRRDRWGWLMAVKVEAGGAPVSRSLKSLSRPWSWSVRIADNRSSPTVTFFDVSAKFSSACSSVVAIGDELGVRFWHWLVRLLLLLHLSLRCGHRPLRMVSNTDVNGDTASLKRKRELKDERALAQKKHRRRSASKLQEDAANTIDDSTSRSAVTQQHTSDLELTDASPELNGALVPASFASWKVSKPMGGRMLDIDPVFSPDER